MFQKKLLTWYEEFGRKLPWRETNNPYYIWLSEIIMQQTRIEQGLAYYELFIKKYPTVKELADASEEDILKSWQGLGYYSRARNLHTAAQQIMDNYNGKFPDTYDGILALKGVGRYTAAAIASFAYGMDYPVIDGNVYRFISRLYGIYTPIGTEQAYKEFEKILMRLIDKEHPGQFNQAMMDFGSTWCKPTGYDCNNCIFKEECEAHQKGKVDLLPVKTKPTSIKKRYFYYFDIRWGCNEKYLLVKKRASGDIWQGLYDFPLYEPNSPIPPKKQKKQLFEILTSWFGDEPTVFELGPVYEHKLTHRTIIAHFIQAKYNDKPSKIPEKTQIIMESEVKTLPISRLIDRYLSKL